jgi:hypothetical protein
VEAVTGASFAGSFQPFRAPFAGRVSWAARIGSVSLLNRQRTGKIADLMAKSGHFWLYRGIAFAEINAFSLGYAREITVFLFFIGTGYLIARNREFNRRNQVICSR